MSIIVNNTSGDVSICGHALKTVLGIKFSRAGQRHASAMGFKSAHHLLDAVKIGGVSRSFDDYQEILKQEMLTHHQISISDDLLEQLRQSLLTDK